MKRKADIRSPSGVTGWGAGNVGQAVHESSGINIDNNNSTHRF